VSDTGDGLVAFLYTDISGISRGRAFPAKDLPNRLKSGVGWVPANQSLSSLGPIADENPWGSLGDLRLMPDPSTEVRVDLESGVPPLHFLLCDATTLEGEGWPSCPRVLLKHALDELTSKTGARMLAAFEHEFHLSLPVFEGAASGAPFSIEALRRAEPFPHKVVAALAASGLEVETFLPEYGPNQYEFACRPVEGVGAADAAVISREVVREVARRCGGRASFSPAVAPGATGNGVHIHFSFRNEDGEVLGYDSDAPGGLDELSGPFAAGVLAHLPALYGFTAASPVSYMRLGPHHWSSGYPIVGWQNREAAVRLPPIVGGDPGQFNLEYRAADATGSPHLALAMLILAGLSGLEGGLAPPEVIEGDPENFSEADLAALDLRPLPDSLPAALDAIEADDAVRSWLDPELLDAYLALKRFELSNVADDDAEQLCARYLSVY
jgi:glutamine synthetase